MRTYRGVLAKGTLTPIVARRLRLEEAASVPSALLALSARFRARFESDLLSFVFFDGDFAGELIELGRRDAHARSDEVSAFFRP